MSRIPAVTKDDTGVFYKLISWYARRRFGAMPAPMAVAAHHGPLFLAGGVHEMLAEKGSRTLPANVRELAVYRTAVRLGCAWCVDFGTMLQKHEGLRCRLTRRRGWSGGQSRVTQPSLPVAPSIDRLKHIDDYATSTLYTHAERLAIAYADAMTDSPVSVTDEQVAQLEAEFGRKGVIELTYQIGLENMRARTNSALGIPAQGFSEACAVPNP